MAKLIVHRDSGNAETLSVEKNTRLSDALFGLSDDLPMDCGGIGVCGKCRVVASGALEPPAGGGACLACQTRIVGDAEVFLSAHEPITNIETGILLPRRCGGAGRGYGLAVDIGTTTVAAVLVDLETGEPRKPFACANPQRAIAGDVIGRIGAAMDGRDTVLRAMIADAVGRLCAAACADAGISPESVVKTVVTGNTTMLYLYTGRNPETLSHAPFEADCLFDCSEGTVYYPPCFGAFVGADIACGVLAVGMADTDETVLFVDLGTNGEIALRHGGRLTVCATAAGPAFEGMNISMGSASIAGAIDGVCAVNGRLDVHVLGGKEPKSICGTGLIDAAAALRMTEQLDETGLLDDDPTVLSGGVKLTQRDIRELQLAKSAIAAGIETLLNAAGIGAEEVDRLCLAGGFGKHLNADSAVLIGLIPQALRTKTKAVGNAALAGAILLLSGGGERARIRKLAEGAQCKNLAAEKGFSDSFMEHMLLEAF